MSQAFSMQLVTALTLANRYFPNIEAGALQQLLPKEYISQCQTVQGIARKFRGSLETTLDGEYKQCMVV
jgi:hypothetical protein